MSACKCQQCQTSFLVVAVRSPCPPSSPLISPLMPTSCLRVPPKRRRTCFTSWMEFWMAASRWVLMYPIGNRSCRPGLTCFSVLSQYQGGNSIHQRILRIIYDVKSTVLVCSLVVLFLCFCQRHLTCSVLLSIQLVYDQSPAAACLLVSFPIIMFCVFCYTCWRVRSAMRDADSDEATHSSASLPQRRKMLVDKKSDWRRPSECQDVQRRFTWSSRLWLCISLDHHWTHQTSYLKYQL